VIYEIVPVVRTVDDHIDNWDAVADFVMKSLSKTGRLGVA
jgi:hypothetical protein